MKPLKVLMVSSECVPFAKTGGLADVVGALPLALKALGHEAIVVMPLYSAINRDKFKLVQALAPFCVHVGDGEEWCAVFQSDIAGFTTYFIEFHKYFDRFGYYHDAQLNDYLDNAYRFGFLGLAALQLCKALGFAPDIVHGHDWQGAVAVTATRDWYHSDPVLGKAATVMTIHNIAYQGIYDKAAVDYLGLGWENFHPDKFESWGKLNLLKGGISSAHWVSTVSPTYAKETKTPELGYGLAPYLNNRGESYWGILNGVDYAQWTPETDKTLPATYSSKNLKGKAVCKKALQERFGLEVDASVPIVGIVSRFAAQKGLDQLAEVIEGIVRDMRVQFVVLGSGDKVLEGFYGDLPRRFPGRIGSQIGYDEALSHLIEAGSDYFIMPSIFEPCGLNQLYSLKYGTLPIVRATGGLDDSVIQYNEATGEGTGFKFADANPTAIYFSVGWAVSTWYDRREHYNKMQQTAMVQDYSWDKSARVYVEMYTRALGR
jgi:starch synthase